MVGFFNYGKTDPVKMERILDRAGRFLMKTQAVHPKSGLVLQNISNKHSMDLLGRLQVPF